MLFAAAVQPPFFASENVKEHFRNCRAPFASLHFIFSWAQIATQIPGVSAADLLCQGK
jgi:hypothetical protein